MSFKDVLAADIANVFLNIDEFAEVHNINGETVPAIVDTDVLKQRSNRQSQNFDGIYKGEVVVFVATTSLVKRPVHGQPLRLDGRLYVVSACAESNGMLEITLEANDS